MLKSLWLFIAGALATTGVIEASKKTCDCCTEFGFFFQKNPTLPTPVLNTGTSNLTENGTVSTIYIPFDTTVFATKNIQLDPNSHGIQLKKPGYYFVEYRITARLVDLGVFQHQPFDAYLTLNGSMIFGSGAPQMTPTPGSVSLPVYVTIAKSLKIKVCDDCSILNLWLFRLNEFVSFHLYAPNPDIDVPASIDLIYLGDLDCACEQPCN